MNWNAILRTFHCDVKVCPVVTGRKTDETRTPPHCDRCHLKEYRPT